MTDAPGSPLRSAGRRTSSAEHWVERAEALGRALPKPRLHPAVLKHADAHVGEPWAVAFSGGADSLSLLLLLWAHWPEQRSRLRVLHFNHRLRGRASTQDAAFCRRVCASLDVAFHTADWTRRTKGKVSEAEAREARHAFFGTAMKRFKAGLLWLGHQQDDIAETLFMRLARGSGAGGLSAPRPMQVMPAGRMHVRPLLTLKHAELEAALRQAGASWQEDASNAGDEFFRNRVRRAVIPAWIEAAGRDALGGAALSRELLEEADEACEAWLDELSAIDGEGTLQVARLAGKPRALWRRALHRWLLLHPAGELSKPGFDGLLAQLQRGWSTRFSLGRSGFAVLKAKRLTFETTRAKRANKSAK